MMSRKKRDVMLSSAGTGNNPAPTATPSIGEVRILPSTTSTYHSGTHMFLYSPTYRWLQPNNADYVSQRTSSRPFYIGHNESFEFNTNDGSMWTWRRIAFAVKDPLFIPLLVQAPVGAQPTPPSGTTRPWRDLSGEATGNYQTAATNVYNFLFLGVDNTDWWNPMTAKTDKTRTTVLYDRSTRFGSGNAAGTSRMRKSYIPLKKTVVYDDEENGQTMSPSAHSVITKQGLGDVYIVDLFECSAPLDPVGSVLSFSCTGTTYWHEK